eukprot:scaffold1870_cov84-Skeletonema_menzelii.AAC.1
MASPPSSTPEMLISSVTTLEIVPGRSIWSGVTRQRSMPPRRRTGTTVYDAGHMVASDQPEHALTMITQFLNGEAF